MIKKHSVAFGNLFKQANGFVIQADERNLANSFFWDELNVSIHAIPLTENWLQALGFIKESNVSNIIYTADIRYKGLMKLHISISDNEPIFSIGDYFPKDEYITVFTGDICKYVHQLQNLYFGLSGEVLPLPTKDKWQDIK